MPVIEVSNLVRQFGAKRAVDNLSFSVEEGEILVIVGASGCGKTTTLRAIAGLDVPTSGTIRIDGEKLFSPVGSPKIGEHTEEIWNAIQGGGFGK